jgi:hypothetical protein
MSQSGGDDARNSFIPALSQTEIELLLASLQKQVAISESILAECRFLKAEAIRLAADTFDRQGHLQTEHCFQRRRCAQSVLWVSARADAYIDPYDQAVSNANDMVAAMGKSPMHGRLSLSEFQLDNTVYLSGEDWMEDIESMLDLIICAVEKHEYRLDQLHVMLSGC